MSVMEQVEADLLAAMKSQDKTRTGALRMLKSALKNALIDKGKMDDALASGVVMKLCKQRKESIEIYEANGRQDLADVEKSELAIIDAYLPKGVSDEELAAIVDEVIAELGGAVDPKKMGPITGAVMKKLAGKPVDGKKVNELVKARVSG